MIPEGATASVPGPADSGRGASDVVQLDALSLESVGDGNANAHGVPVPVRSAAVLDGEPTGSLRPAEAAAQPPSEGKGGLKK